MLQQVLVARAALGCWRAAANAAVTRTPATTTAGQTRPPATVLRSPEKYGYRFARAPIIVLDDDTFELYLRTNKPLRKKPGEDTAAARCPTSLAPSGAAWGRNPRVAMRNGGITSAPP